MDESEKNKVNILSIKENDIFNSPSTGDESSAYGKDIINTHELLTYINQARQNPTLFQEEIAKYISSIVTKENEKYLQINNSTFINLSTGIEAFNSAIVFLNTQKVLKPYIMLDELKLPFPTFNPDLAIDYNYLNKILFQKAKELKDQLDIVNFHYDKIVYNPKLAVVLQVVDDTNSNYLRRKNLFLEEAKYIGISGGKIKKNVYCFYYIFAKERKRLNQT